MYKIIKPDNNKNIISYIKEIYRFRSYILLFTKRDLKIKYAQTVLGVLWTLIQPIVGLIIFTYFFGKLINIGTDGSPYPVFVFPGIIAWYCFSFIVAYSGISLIESQNLVKKIYFPKIILPISKSLTSLTELLIWFVILFAILIIFNVTPGFKILFLPIFILLNILTGLSIGIWLSALTYRFRDLIHIIPYLVGFSIFVTPVFYPVNIIPENMNILIYMNPMAGVIQGYRWCIFEQADYSIKYLLGFGIMMSILLLGIKYFTKIDKKISDVI